MRLVKLPLGMLPQSRLKEPGLIILNAPDVIPLVRGAVYILPQFLDGSGVNNSDFATGEAGVGLAGEKEALDVGRRSNDIAAVGDMTPRSNHWMPGGNLKTGLNAFEVFGGGAFEAFVQDDGQVPKFRKFAP